MKEGNVYYDVLICNLKMSESREKSNFSEGYWQGNKSLIKCH